MRLTHLGSLILLVLASFTTCLSSPTAASATPSAEPDKLSLYHSEGLHGPLAKQLEQPLMVKVVGPEQRNLLGSVQRHPVAGATVRFELTASSQAWGGQLEKTQAQTDAGGIARTHLTLGQRPGRYEIQAWAVRSDGKEVGPVLFNVIGGVWVKGGSQDARAGNPVQDPLEVYVEKAPGVPQEGAQIEASILKAAGKAKISPERARTDAKGYASFIVVPGDSNGETQISLDISHPSVDGEWLKVGSVPVHFFAFAPLTLMIAVLGGLAIFIFGMDQLSKALTMIAGDRLRQWLNFLTRNRVMGILAGTVITGLIQSSSATSVMVLGFVNAGLFELKQAISVIFGANIGTTVTAQMISFKLEVLALPAVALGVVVMMVAHRETNKQWGNALIGFGLLFLGLSMMSSPLKSLSHSQAMVNLFAGLDCTPVDGKFPISAPMKGILVGMVVTMVIQSSSAAIGLLLTLVSTGVLNVWAAFPILLGSNIGTTITAVLASIGTNRAARRTALAHIMFNVIGVVMMVALLYVNWNGHPVFLELVNRITGGNAFAGENMERFLANAHTLFNVGAAILFIPLIGIFVKICYMVFPKLQDESESEQIQYLEPHLLATPSVAISQVYREIAFMSRQGLRAFRVAEQIAHDGAHERFEKQYERIQRREAQIDRLQEEILTYIQKISCQRLNEEQSRMIPRLVHAVNQAESIGDHCVAILRLLRRINKRDIALSEEAKQGILEMFETVGEMYERVLDGLEHGNPKLYQRTAGLRKRVVLMRKNLHKQHLVSMENQPEELRAGVVVIEMLNQLDEISDHLSQITEAYKSSLAWEEPEKSSHSHDHDDDNDHDSDSDDDHDLHRTGVSASSPS